jgi:hypothetical protein
MNINYTEHEKLDLVFYCVIIIYSIFFKSRRKYFGYFSYKEMINVLENWYVYPDLNITQFILTSEHNTVSYKCVI